MDPRQAAFSFSFSPQEGVREPIDLVLLEQREWRPYAGIVTKANMVRYLARILYGDQWQEQIDCGLSGDAIVIGIYVYPLRPGVRFRLAATIGELSDGDYDEVEERESVHFNLEQEARLRHPALRVIDAKWLAGPYLAGGVKTAPPALRVAGQRLFTAVPVFGSVHVTTVVPRWLFLLTVNWDAAASALTGGWAEFAACYPPPGRPVALGLSAPPGAQEMAELGLPCGYSFHGSSSWPQDDNWPPKETGGKTKRISGDYCSLTLEQEG